MSYALLFTHAAAQVFEIVSAYGTVGLSLGIPGVRSYLHAPPRVLTMCAVQLLTLRRDAHALQTDHHRGHASWQTPRAPGST